MKKGIIERLATALFENYIQSKDKAKLSRGQDIFSLIGSSLVTIVSYISAFNGIKLLWIALIILVFTIVGYMALNKAIELIDNNTASELYELKSDLKTALDTQKAIKEQLKKEQEICLYARNLYASSMAIQKAIVRTNAQSSTAAGVYSSFTQAIVHTMEQCFYIPHDNYQILIYGYDGTRKVVRRLDVESTVKTKQAAGKSSKLNVDDEKVKKYYYVQALTSPNTYFSMKNNEEIRANFYFESDDEEEKKQYSQYVGMSCKIDSKRKLYFEIIAYNDLRFDDHCESLGDFTKKVIAPYTTLLASVNWEHVRRDLDA